MKYLSLIVLITLLASCGAEEVKPSEVFTQSDDYLIFGRSFGHCHGEECVEIFLIDNSGLYEDNKDNLPSWTEPYDGNYTKLSDAKYQAVKNLSLGTPDYLLQNTDTVYGCPDCADGGAIYLEIKQGNDRRFWLLDNSKYQVPEEIHSIIDHVREAVELINQ